MKIKFLFSVLIISMVFLESDHIHNHSHNNEFGMAIGIVPGHDQEDDNVGLHLHYIIGLGEDNDFGIGFSVESIFDEHKHNSISLIGTYHFDSGYTIAYAPGILFKDHDGKTESTFAQHLEFYYEFEFGKFHIGPQFDIGFEDNEIHYMLGLHLGIDIEGKD